MNDPQTPQDQSQPVKLGPFARLDALLPSDEAVEAEYDARTSHAQTTRRKATNQGDNDFAAYDPSEAVSVNPANIGGDFNGFLTEEGILEEVQAAAEVTVREMLAAVPSQGRRRNALPDSPAAG